MPHKDPEARRTYERARYASPEVKAARKGQQAASYLRHREMRVAEIKAYRTSDLGRAKKKAHYEANKERYREWSRAHRARNPEARKQEYRRWRDLNGRLGARAKHLKEKFGLTPEQYAAMLGEQGGGCAICHKPPQASYGRGKVLEVDHCHDSGRIRGLLCRACNTMVGYFEKARREQKTPIVTAYIERI